IGSPVTYKRRNISCAQFASIRHDDCRRWPSVSTRRPSRRSQPALAESAYASALASYLSKLEELPRLSQEEERLLAQKWADTRDPRAGERLVLCNLRFVVKIALEYRSYRVPLLDLVQEGNLGLLTAVGRFDPDRNTRLTTYAVWWIRA